MSTRWPSAGFTRQLSDRVSAFVDTPYAEYTGFITSQQVIVMAIRRFLSDFSYYTSFLEISDIGDKFVFFKDHESDQTVQVNVGEYIICKRHNSDECVHTKFAAYLPMFNRQLNARDGKIHNIKQRMLNPPSEKPVLPYTTKKIPARLLSNVERFLKTSNAKQLGYVSKTQVFVVAVNVFLDSIEKYTSFMLVEDIKNNEWAIIFDQSLGNDVKVINRKGIISCSYCQTTSCDHVKFAVSHIPRFHKAENKLEQNQFPSYSDKEIDIIIKTLKEILEDLDSDNYKEVVNILHKKYGKNVKETCSEPFVLMKAIVSMYGNASKSIVLKTNSALSTYKNPNLDMFSKQLMAAYAAII